MIDLRRCSRGVVAVTVAMAMFPTTAAATEGSSAEAGASQSPIDIRTSAVTFVDDLPSLNFRYHTVPIEVVNTGSPDPETTIRGEVESGATLRSNGKSYSLLQFHFHTTSEHRLDGEVFPMEMHLVHQAEDGEQLVIGVWIEAGDRNRDLAPIFADLPADETEMLTIHRFDLDELIPDDDDTYRYQGSLTTPPFTEGVQWIVFDEPLEMSPGQISSFQALFPEGNSREPQPLNDRPILSDVDDNDRDNDD
jgi:carbonic anhydrase